MIRRLKAVGLDRQEDPVLGSQKRASVLIPLTPDGCILLTQRPSTLRTHAGEVCFPGGKQDAEDQGDDIRTALRETREEVGLTAIEPICRFPAVESYHGLCVTPIVGRLAENIDDVDQLQLSENEVAAVFLVPFDFFADDKNLSEPVKSIEWRGGTFDMRTYQYTYKGRTFTIWGLTAHLAHQAAFVASSSLSKGYLHRFDDDRSVWRKRYFEVTGDGMLHHYDTEREANNKQSASKKNRLSLKYCQVDVAEASPECFGFRVRALDGRIIWTLAAETEIERQQWSVSLRLIGQE